MNNKIFNLKNRVMLGGLLFLIVINQPLLKEGLQRSIRGLFVSYGFIVIVAYWGVSALEKVREKTCRRAMFWIVAMLILWLGCRGIKYEVWYDKLETALWYLFYMPQTLLPALIYYLTLFIDGSKKHKYAKLIFVPAALIVLGILTNSIHQLAFRFHTESHTSDYSYGPLYYVSLIWMFFFLFAAIIHAVRKSKNLNRRRIARILMIWMFAPILYLIYYLFGPFWLRTYFLNFPDAFCLIYIVIIEICMESGLLLTNKNHRILFAEAPIMAEITDERGATFQKTKICPEITDEQKTQVENGNVFISEGLELRKNAVYGGHVYWVNDVKEITRINKKLESIGELLAEENHLLEAEIAMKEKQAVIEEQNIIYDQMQEILEEKTRTLQGLLEDKTQLNRALFIAAYMKRKSNLVILSWQEKLSDIRELGLCINESFSYLNLNGCLCNCTVQGTGKVPATELAAVYDSFEEILEENFDEAQACLCFIRLIDGQLSVRLQLELDDTRFITITEKGVSYE